MRTGKKDFIRVEITVDRDSQKGIIIGKGGGAIKKLAEESRKEIELFLEKKVFLEVQAPMLFPALLRLGREHVHTGG